MRFGDISVKYGDKELERRVFVISSSLHTCTAKQKQASAIMRNVYGFKMDGCAKMQALKMAADATSSFGVKFRQRAAIITNSSAANRAARVCNVYVGSVQTKEHKGTPV